MGNQPIEPMQAGSAILRQPPAWNCRRRVVLDARDAEAQQPLAGPPSSSITGNHLSARRQRRDMIERCDDVESLRGPLRLDRPASELGRPLDRQIAGLRAFENFVHVDRATPEQVGEARAIGHEAADCHELASRNVSQAADAMLQVRRWASVRGKAHCSATRQAHRGAPGRCGECAVQLAGTPDLDELKLHPDAAIAVMHDTLTGARSSLAPTHREPAQRASSTLRASRCPASNVLQILCSPNASRCQRAAIRETVGSIVLSSSRRLTTSSRAQIGEAGDVSTGTRKARRKPVLDRIAHGRRDDRDGGGHLPAQRAPPACSRRR